MVAEERRRKRWEFLTVAEKVEALYDAPAQLPTDDLGPNMARSRREHQRMLGNGYCARPKVMDCQFENICESCTFLQTGVEFRPTLLAQRQDTCNPVQTRRTEILDQLITRLGTTEASDTDHPHSANERIGEVRSESGMVGGRGRYWLRCSRRVARVRAR